MSKTNTTKAAATERLFSKYSSEELRHYLKELIQEILKEELIRLKPPLSEPLSISEAADFLKMKVNTLYEKTSKKLIPHSKIGNKLYFNRPELEEWIRQGKVKTTWETENDVLNREKKCVERLNA